MEFIKHKFKTIKKVYIFNEYKYKHCFALGYLKLEKSYFSKKHEWFYREKRFYIPKLVNNLLKCIFGKNHYCVHRKEDGYGYITEMTDLKTCKRYIAEFKEFGFTDIYIAEKYKKYYGWLWITKKERRNEDKFYAFMMGAFG